MVAQVQAHTSMPELPQPTTSTRAPRYGSPDLYSDTWVTGPLNEPAPGNSGRTRSAFSPVATTSHRPMYSVVVLSLMRSTRAYVEVLTTEG